MLRKKYFYLIGSAIVFILASCKYSPFWSRTNRQTNYMFEGFFTTTREDDNLYYFLKVTNITKEQFENAKGTNVINDFLYRESGPKYYLLDFYACSENNPYSNRIETYSFFNLDVRSPNVKTEPIGYFDDNNNIVTPKPRSNSISTYYIEYNEKYFSFFKEV